MALREGDETVLFEGVLVVDRRPQEKRDKSVICRFADGTERPVPRSQVEPGFAFPGDSDSNQDQTEVFDVEISRWMVDQWANEQPPEPVVIRGVEVLRFSDGEYGPSLQVRLPGGNTKWVKTRSLHPESPCREEGDRGELWVMPWAAKYLGVEAPKPRSHVGQDARAGVGKGEGGGSGSSGATPKTSGGSPETPDDDMDIPF